MKRCARCKEDKPLDQFGKNRRRPDGLHYYCLECARAHSREAGRKFTAAKPERRRAIRQKSRLLNREKSRIKDREHSRKYREKNLEKTRAKAREYARAHRIEIREKKRQWREANPELAKAEAKANWDRWRKTHPDEVREARRQWELDNPEKVRASRRKTAEHRRQKALAKRLEKGSRPKKDRNKPRGNYKLRQRRYRDRHLDKIRARRRAYQAKRRSAPAQRALDAVRRRIRHVCNGKSKGALIIFGYTAADLRAHLEAQFEPRMTWSNYGLYGDKWHVDHKRQVNSFKLPDELAECFALANLRPLWAADNLARKKKYDALEHAVVI